MAKNYVKLWREKKESVLSKYGSRCAYCGCELTRDTMQMDHIIPKTEFLDYLKARQFREAGIKRDDISNLNPSCETCNDSKGICTIERFRERLEYVIDRLRNDTPHFILAEKYGMVTATPKKVVFYFETFLSNG